MTELPPRRRRKRKKPIREKVSDRDDADDGSADPLGSLMEKHEITLGPLIVVCVLLLFAGGGAQLWGFLQDPWTRTSITVMIVGGFVSLMGIILFGMNVPNLGRRLELRKRGLRFLENNVTTELRWEEIVAVEVDRMDSTNIGIGTVNSRGRDAAAVSGPLTKTEFDVSIIGDDDQTIRLTSLFLRTVPDAQQLISNLKLRAGI